MKSSTITAEETARREWDSIQSPDKVDVRVNARWLGNIFLPCGEGEQASEEVRATFGAFTFGDNFVIEKATMKVIHVGDREGEVITQEPNEFRRLMVKKSLLEWSLPILIERDNGWMTSECYQRVGSVAGPLMDALLNEFHKSTIVTEEEERLIDRQCAILFSEHSRGVANACEAVSMFCTLGSFWEKFGINRDNIPAVPLREYIMLKAMMRKEGEALKSKARPKNTGGTRIAGAGGKTRPSAGKRIAL